MPRNYMKEYDKFHKSKASKKARARRNKAHRKAKPAKGMEVHHTKPHAKGKTKVVTRKTNRRIGKPGRRRRTTKKAPRA